MAMRSRDALLLAPALVIGVGMTIETLIGARWAEFAPFAMAPLSAGPILAYVLLKWRSSSPIYAG